MGHCLSKFPAVGGSDSVQNHQDSPLAIPQQAANKGKNLVAPHPSDVATSLAGPESSPVASFQSPVLELQADASSKDLANGRTGVDEAAPVGRMKRSHSLAVRHPSGRAPLVSGASALVAAAAAATAASEAKSGGGPSTTIAEKEQETSKEAAVTPRRHVSLQPAPMLQRRGSHRAGNVSSAAAGAGVTATPTQSRRVKKPAAVMLEVLFRDERARLGFFTYLQATALQEKIREAEATETDDDARRLKRRMSKLTSSRVTSDYREDCVLFWLEMSDLLKIPSGGSFQLGLLRDLFDVYVAKGALRQLPMVSAAEREPLAQFLQDKNADRALLAYKMLLLDVLEVVTTHFDEYVRADGKLGYAHATRSASMRNVLARLAKVNIGNPGDRRAHLNEIVCTPALCRIFREFLEDRNSVESLLFVIDALAFEDLVNTFALEPELQSTSDSGSSLHDFCLRQAQKIFNKYIRYGSKAEICLGGAVKEKLLREIVEYPIGADVFSDAVLVCSAELVHSHLDQFYGTAAYLAYKAARSSQGRASKSGRRTSGTILKRSSIDNGQTGSGDRTRVGTAAESETGGLVARLVDDSAQDDDFAGDGPLLSLSDILNGGGASYFRDFLKEDGAENTLFFYKEVAEYQLLPHGQHHYIQSKARKIFDKFVRRGGKLEVDLPADVRRDILWKLSAPTEHTFADAQKYVLNLWERSALPRFRRHRCYGDMMTALHKLPHYGLAVGPNGGTDSRAHSYPSAVAASSGDMVDIARITLREFLDLDFLRRYFRLFLEKEQCANELFFYFEILSFQQFPTSDYLSRQAKKIFSRFCEPTSREFVALAPELRAELQASLNNPRPAMFNKAQEEIVAFFATTLFPKFQHSELYRTIRITHAELRLAKLAASGSDAGTVVHVRGRSGTYSDAGYAPRPSTSPVRGRASVAPGTAELSEEQVTVKLILEHQETRALFLFFSEEMYVCVEWTRTAKVCVCEADARVRVAAVFAPKASTSGSTATSSRTFHTRAT